MMMDPQLLTDIVGIVLFCGVCLWQYIGAKKAKAAMAA
jgi:hypothetical protein